MGAVGPVAEGATATSWLAGTPASRAMIVFTGVEAIRLASRVARELSASAPFGLRSTTWESGVSTRTRAEATPTWYWRLSSLGGASEMRYAVISAMARASIAPRKTR